MGVVTLAGVLKGVTAAAAVGGAATSAKSAHFAERSAKKQEKAADALLAEEEKAREQTAFSVLKRRKSGEGSARDTILTSPLGVTGEATKSGKTLLGA